MYSAICSHLHQHFLLVLQKAVLLLFSSLCSCSCRIVPQRAVLLLIFFVSLCSCSCTTPPSFLKGRFYCLFSSLLFVFLFLHLTYANLFLLVPQRWFYCLFSSFLCVLV